MDSPAGGRWIRTPGPAHGSERHFWSWLHNLRSCRSQPAEAPPVSSALTSHEPGDFLIESLLRILHIDRGINALLAVRRGPAHPRLGKEYGQPETRPVVLEAAVASEDPPNDAIANQRLHLYGARGKSPLRNACGASAS